MKKQEQEYKYIETTCNPLAEHVHQGWSIGGKKQTVERHLPKGESSTHSKTTEKMTSAEMSFAIQKFKTIQQNWRFQMVKENKNTTIVNKCINAYLSMTKAYHSVNRQHLHIKPVITVSKVKRPELPGVLSHRATRKGLYLHVFLTWKKSAGLEA